MELQAAFEAAFDAAFLEYETAYNEWLRKHEIHDEWEHMMNIVSYNLLFLQNITSLISPGLNLHFCRYQRHRMFLVTGERGTDPIPEPPARPGPPPREPSREMFARAYYSETSVSKLANKLLPISCAFEVANFCSHMHVGIGSLHARTLWSWGCLADGFPRDDTGWWCLAGVVSSDHTGSCR